MQVLRLRIVISVTIYGDIRILCRKGNYMQVYSGKSVFGGIAIGRISIFKTEKKQIFRRKIKDSRKEFERYKEARKKASEQLDNLYNKALKEVGEANAAIFEVHRMMLEDEDYNESIENIIKSQNVNAEFAVASTSDNFQSMFSAMDDEYMKERAADIKDISERIINILVGDTREETVNERNSIIVASDLAPSQTVAMDKDKVISFVTSKGSTNSHTAILARTMGIPALVSADIPLDDLLDGAIAIVDGFEGKIYVNPTDEILAKKQKLQNEDNEKKQLLLKLKGQDTVTLDGKKIMLYANIGNLKDLAMVLENDAEGIGLFRSEFIYLERDNFPTEEEQFKIYKTVAETMAEKPVIIRTLDIGADKMCDYFDLEKEENPALGYRAIRICLTRTDIFKTQLRAIFRAAVYGNIKVMYPMIISLEEVHRIRKIVGEVEEELKLQKINYRIPEQGIMIETPAAALISDKLAKEVDFFSIGTNDLSQYTLAIDRQNPKLESFFNPYHESILKLMELVCKNAHDAGIWAGVCGELGADLSMTERFLKMGVDELSVSPGRVLALRDKIRKIKC